MTTENTDAGIRILAKAIRKLTARLAIADEREHRRDEALTALGSTVDGVRATLVGGNLPMWERLVISPESIEELAEKRMAELAVAQKMSEALSGEMKVSRAQRDELQERIDKALEVLPSSLVDERPTFDQIMNVRAILRGEAQMSAPTPDTATVRGRYCDGAYLQTGHTTDGEDFDRWLAERDREAATGRESRQVDLNREDRR